MSSLMPRAPWIWIARSTTSCMTPATWNLMSEIASRAAPDALGVDRPGRVQDQEPRGVDGRPDSAIQFCTVWRLPSGSPGASCRVAARSHIRSRAHRQTPIQRIACWIRPGPRRACAIANPAPSVPSRFSRGTRQSSKTSSAWLAQSSPACPMHGMLRTRR